MNLKEKLDARIAREKLWPRPASSVWIGSVKRKLSQAAFNALAEHAASYGGSLRYVKDLATGYSIIFEYYPTTAR